MSVASKTNTYKGMVIDLARMYQQTTKPDFVPTLMREVLIALHEGALESDTTKFTVDLEPHELNLNHAETGECLVKVLDLGANGTLRDYADPASQLIYPHGHTDAVIEHFVKEAPLFRPMVESLDLLGKAARIIMGVVATDEAFILTFANVKEQPVVIFYRNRA